MLWITVRFWYGLVGSSRLGTAGSSLGTSGRRLEKKSISEIIFSVVLILVISIFACFSSRKLPRSHGHSGVANIQNTCVFSLL